MIKRFFIILSVLGCALAYGPAYALSFSFSFCKFVLPSEAPKDGDLAELFQIAEPDGAVRVCDLLNGKMLYEIATPISQEGDVAYFYSTSIFKIEEAEGHRWDYDRVGDTYPPSWRTAYMRIGEGAVEHDAEGFVPVTGGLSPREFSLLNKAWSDIRSSKWEFFKASLNMSLFNRLRSDHQLLKKALYEEGEDLSQIEHAYCPDGGEYTSALPCSFSVGKTVLPWHIGFEFVGDAIGFEEVELPQPDHREWAKKTYEQLRKDEALFRLNFKQP